MAEVWTKCRLVEVLQHISGDMNLCLELFFITVAIHQD